MRFKYIIYATSIFISCAFLACKKDLGNYNYLEIPELRIDTTGSPGPFAVKQGIEELVITPHVTYTGNQTLDYYWIYGTTSNDTIWREKDLNIRLDQPIGSNRPLYFQVVERETGNMAVIEYRVTITGAFSTGLVVAHEKDGSADIDLIGTPLADNNPIQRNIHQTVNGTRLVGKVTGLSSVGQNSLFMFMTDQHASLMSFDGMITRFSDEEVFGLIDPGGFRPDAIGFYSTRTNFMINQGKVYQNFIDNTSPGTMTQRVTMADGSDYRMSPFYIRPNAKGGIFFDELNHRLVQISDPSGINMFDPVIAADSGARFSLHHIDRKFLYAKPGFQLYTGFFGILNTTLYAFFADHAGSGRYLYVMGVDSPEAPDFALIDIGTQPDIQQAAYYEVIDSTPCVYYATDNKVYLLQVNVTGNSVVNAGVQFTPVPGEEISCIKLVSPYCYIATWNQGTGEGKVYQFQVATGTGLFATSPVKTWTDFGGKITRMEMKLH